MALTLRLTDREKAVLAKMELKRIREGRAALEDAGQQRLWGDE